MHGNIRGRDKFKKYKSIINMMVRIFSLLPAKIRKKMFVLVRNIDGIIGLGIRYVIFKSIAGQCGDNVAIYPNVYILHTDNIYIGNNVSIQPFCYLEGGESEGGIFIKNNVSLAHGVTIMSTTHTFNEVNLPIRDQPIENKKVIIGNDVWIGAKATVLCGNEVEDRVVIGAGAIVTKNIKGNSVCAGVPAQIIKKI